MDNRAIKERLRACWNDGKPFEACRGRHSGTLIAMASGPSAADFPIERYRHVPMIAMNGSIVRFAEAGIRPLFYLCDDRGFVRLRQPLVRQGIELAEHAALGAGALEVLLEQAPDALDGRSVYLMQRTNRPLDGEELSDRAYAWSVRKDPDLECRFSLWRQKPNRIGFSRNMVKGYFCGRTIPFAAMQLGYHLGFRNVVLVGVDMGAQPGASTSRGMRLCRAGSTRTTTTTFCPASSWSRSAWSARTIGCSAYPRSAACRSAWCLVFHSISWTSCSPARSAAAGRPRGNPGPCVARDSAADDESCDAPAGGPVGGP